MAGGERFFAACLWWAQRCAPGRWRRPVRTVGRANTATDVDKTCLDSCKGLIRYTGLHAKKKLSRCQPSVNAAKDCLASWHSGASGFEKAN